MYYDFTRENVHYTGICRPVEYELDLWQTKLRHSGILLELREGMTHTPYETARWTTLEFTTACGEEVYVFLRELGKICGLSCSPLYNHNLRRIYDQYERQLLRQKGLIPA